MQYNRKGVRSRICCNREIFVRHGSTRRLGPTPKTQIRNTQKKCGRNTDVRQPADTSFLLGTIPRRYTTIFQTHEQVRQVGGLTLAGLSSSVVLHFVGLGFLYSLALALLLWRICYGNCQTITIFPVCRSSRALSFPFFSSNSFSPEVEMLIEGEEEEVSSELHAHEIYPRCLSLFLLFAFRRKIVLFRGSSGIAFILR